jgi:hypothetical protein
LAIAALSQFHGSQIAAEERHFGEQLSRLQEAHKLMSQADNYLESSYTSENSEITKALHLAKKDNDFIV